MCLYVAFCSVISREFAAVPFSVFDYKASLHFIMAVATLYSTLKTQAASTFFRMWGISSDCCLYISIDYLFLLFLLSITEALSVCSS